MSSRVPVIVAVVLALLLILGLMQLFESSSNTPADADGANDDESESRAAQLTGNPTASAPVPPPVETPEALPESPPERAGDNATSFGGEGNVGFNGLLREDLRKLGGFETSPPGTLSGLLLDGKEPFADAEALLWPRGFGAGRRGVPAGSKPMQTALIASDGTFSFSHLEPDWYFVGVRVPGGPARLALRFLNPAGETTRTVIVLGTARVYGTLYDQAGRPLPGESARIEIKGERGVSTTVVETRADQRGNYEFTQLLGGHAYIRVARQNDFNFISRRTLRFTLKPGAEVRQDLGKPKR